MHRRLIGLGKEFDWTKTAAATRLAVPLNSTEDMHDHNSPSYEAWKHCNLTEAAIVCFEDELSTVLKTCECWEGAVSLQGPSCNLVDRVRKEKNA